MTTTRVVIRVLLAILLTVTALSAVLASAPRGQRFSSGVEAVRVDVLVSEGGRPVRGLTAADFEVRDNGVLQEVTLVGFERALLNVVLVVDLSASVAGERLEHLQHAGRGLLARLRPEDRAAILGFSHVLVRGSPLTRDRTRLLWLLNEARPAGDTALVDATYAGMMLGESEEGRALVMVFSDGLDVASWLPAPRVLEVARRSEVVVYGISMKGSRPTFLEQMSAQTGGRLLDVDSRRLSDTFLAVLDEFRERCLLSYSPRAVPGGGWHALDVRVKGRQATVRARPGYLAGNPR